MTALSWFQQTGRQECSGLQMELCFDAFLLELQTSRQELVHASEVAVLERQLAAARREAVDGAAGAGRRMAEAEAAAAAAKEELERARQEICYLETKVSAVLLSGKGCAGCARQGV